VKYFSIVIGGAIGTLLRFLAGSWILTLFPLARFPWGTFTINLLGSFIIGLLAGLNQVNPMNPTTKLFLFTGILGGFTTYSGYALETFSLLRQNENALALIYILSTTILGIALAAAGYWISIQLIKS
jgi:CrcB protein